MKAALISAALVCTSTLYSGEFHTGCETPVVGTVIVRSPSSCEIVLSEGKYSLSITRFEETEEKYTFIRFGYWTMTDEELVALFKGSLPFNFTP